MCRLWTTTLRLFGLLLLAPASANAQQMPNAAAIAPLVGNWDLPGTQIRLKIHPDWTVDHSALGEGTIRHDETIYYRLVFRQKHLECSYEVRKYSDNELTFTVAVHPSDSDCELGAMRRSPGTSAPSDATKNKGSEAATATSVAEKSDPSAPGTIFKDCDDCPELVVVPSGRFTMGSQESEPGRYDIEGPQRSVEIASSFAVGRYAITRDQYEQFVKATGRAFDDGCYVESGGRYALKSELSFRSPGFRQDDRHPVVCVSWFDAHAYIKWLSEKTGKSYRLLTEAEREYVTRAGSSSPYWWGDTPRPDRANYYLDQSETSSAESAKAKVANAGSKVGLFSNAPSPTNGTVPVYLFQPNPWGLYQVHGNVAEWVEDCWNRSYMGAPANAESVKTGDCDRRVLRGGSWNYKASDIRSAYRESARKEDRYVHVGFRIARDIS